MIKWHCASVFTLWNPSPSRVPPHANTLSMHVCVCLCVRVRACVISAVVGHLNYQNFLPELQRSNQSAQSWVLPPLRQKLHLMYLKHPAALSHCGCGTGRTPCRLNWPLCSDYWACVCRGDKSEQHGWAVFTTHTPREYAWRAEGEMPKCISPMKDALKK